MTIQEIQVPMPEPGTLTYRQLAPLYARIVQQISSCGDRLPEKVAQAKTRAAKRALEHLLMGHWWSFDPLTQSARFASDSTPEIIHDTTPAGCDCPAAVNAKEKGRDDLVCWHKPGRVLLWLLSQEQGQDTEDRQPLPFYEPEPSLPPSQQPSMLYRCRYCPSPMVPATTIAGEVCIECTGCGWQNHRDDYAAPPYALEPLTEQEQAYYIKLLGLNMLYPAVFGRAA